MKKDIKDVDGHGRLSCDCASLGYLCMNLCRIRWVAELAAARAAEDQSAKRVDALAESSG